MEQKLKFRYEVTDGDLKGSNVRILGAVVALELDGGGADLYFPCECSNDLGVPVFIPKADIKDRLTIEDFAELFNSFEGADADVKRLKWLQGNKALNLTVHVSEDYEVFASNTDFFNSEEEQAAQIPFHFDENLVSARGVKTLLDALDIKTEYHADESSEMAPEEA